jgi:uncharacterized repeat protein (TIGR03803 family)
LVAAALLAASNSSAQTYAVLHSFSGPDGADPRSALILRTDGNFYGTTTNGGSGSCPAPGVVLPGCGTVFKMDLSGNLTTLHSFIGGPNEGSYPIAGLVESHDGNFYGTTYGGGVGNCASGGFAPCGTVFKMDSVGNLTTLHRFTLTDGGTPSGGLLQTADGNFFGMTQVGGANGYGTIFRIDPSGTLVTLHSFSGTDGGQPFGALIEASDGNLYGRNQWTVFRVDLSGNLTTLHTLESSTGLTQGFDGNLYGTTGLGGTGSGRFFSGYGTVFKMDLPGNFTILYSFSGTGSDGGHPYAGLIQASNGNFYGTTFGRAEDPVVGYGTIFEIDYLGNLTTLHSFTGPDGASPVGPLIQAPDGSFYGMTSMGGTTGDGVVFRLTANLACPLNTETLCLNQGRFIVNAQWTDFQGNTGTASVVPGASSADSGVMWFFGPDNWELLIKVLNGCGVNGHYWVFGGAATNVQYTIQVTDTQTGEFRTYTNPLGTVSPAITDTVAFGACP